MNSSKDIIQLIKKIREDKKITVEALANKVGISKSTLSRYENAQRDFPINDVGKYADALGVDVEFLLGIKKPTNIIPLTPATVKIPILGKIACGDPITAEQNVEGYIYKSPEQLPNGELFALIAKGDSMEPTIPDGAIVLLRVQPDVENGELAAVLVNGDEEATLKRIRKENNSIWLVPDNPKHHLKQITEDYQARIIGKAISYEISL